MLVLALCLVLLVAFNKLVFRKICCSFCIQVIDLLNSNQRTYLAVRWSRHKGFYVENLFHVECESIEDLFAVLEEGTLTHYLVGCF